MSKELEALKEIKASHLQAHIDSKNIGDFNIWFDEYYEAIKKALTPPTEEEVCKVLSEYYSLTNLVKFEYDEEKMCFYEIESRDIIVSFNGILLKIFKSLPLSLITLIGRFYEGERK